MFRYSDDFIDCGGWCNRVFPDYDTVPESAGVGWYRENKRAFFKNAGIKNEKNKSPESGPGRNRVEHGSGDFRFYLAANSSIMSQIIVMASDFVESSIALM